MTAEVAINLRNQKVVKFKLEIYWMKLLPRRKLIVKTINFL